MKRDISFYSFIYHYKEEDEAKDHIHLFVMPNGRIDTDRFCDYLIEIDTTNIQGLPLKCLPCKSSKWDNWYLYGIHDSAYLATKGQTRLHHYENSDIVASDVDYLHEMITTIDRTKFFKTYDFIEKVKSGAKFEDLLLSGQIPVAQIFAWRTLYEYLDGHKISRNGRNSHSSFDSVDNETGEVLEVDTTLPPPTQPEQLKIDLDKPID